ncbi:MAG: hypothetical protein AAGA85_05430 [Bacteroidota bacterium]
MKRVTTPILLLLSLMATLCAPAHGGGWTQPKGSGFVKFGQFFLLADQNFDSNGDKMSITSSGFFSTHLYAEYGLLDRVTVGAYVPFLFHSYVNGLRYTSGLPDLPGMEATHFGDVDVFVQYGLIQNRAFVLSAGVLLGIPSGNSEGLLTSGDGEFNQMIRLEAGYSVPSLPIFIGLSTGFNNRTRGFDDEIRINAEVGLTIKEKVVLILKSLNTRSLQNGEGQIADGGIFSNDIDYSTLGPEVLVKDVIGGLGVTANYYWTLSGRNTIANNSFTLGVFWEF